MVRQQSGGIRLPQSILDEINGASVEQSRGRGHGSKSKLSRKEARKQEREGRKQRKAQYFSAAHTANPVKRRAEEYDHVDSPKRKKAKTESGTAPPAPAAKLGKQEGDATSAEEKLFALSKKTTTAPDKKIKEKKAKDSRKPSALAKLAGETSKKSSKVTPRSRVEADEDNYIAYLESKLGLKGGKKKKSNPEEDDGLDDLLDFASKFDSFDGAAEAEVRFRHISSR
ncbi:hypothetical protein K523DRAFT_233623 [Schizophyllum commune Tattone D]|nr:hypothetical protein K523DRAFT_233623 [Schizophyllum commune Tattone D]